MAAMYAKWPRVHEVATWYALSLLGTVRPTDRGFRRQALAASIVETVYKENPKHPGAAHFIIHAFDDPDHAPLALPAARAYASIAPSAAHALHLPSHIFVQLGMWGDVRTSNIAAYKAATELNARLKLAEGREDFHTLSWLTYANLMAGNIDEARQNVALAKQAADRNAANRGQKEDALRLAKEAMDIELTLAAPSGPPDPIKPAPEFYGELLLDAGRGAEAVPVLELSLQRTPNRAASVKALARARSAATSLR